MLVTMIRVVCRGVIVTGAWAAPGLVAGAVAAYFQDPRCPEGNAVGPGGQPGGKGPGVAGRVVSVPRPVLMNRIVPGIGRLPGCCPVHGLTGPPSTSSLPVTVPPDDAGRVGGAALTRPHPRRRALPRSTTTPATWFTCLAMMAPYSLPALRYPPPAGPPAGTAGPRGEWITEDPQTRRPPGFPHRAAAFGAVQATALRRHPGCPGSTRSSQILASYSYPAADLTPDQPTSTDSMTAVLAGQTGLLPVPRQGRGVT